MSVEIEHKYLVVNDSYKSMAHSHTEISQGYLQDDPSRTVRVRTLGEKGFITVKGKNEGAARLEFEYEIPAEDARLLLGLCYQPVLRKTRWYVDFEGFTWEVDEYHSPLAPLTVAEVELPSEEIIYNVAPFAGENVTGNPEYYNSVINSRLRGL